MTVEGSSLFYVIEKVNDRMINGPIRALYNLITITKSTIRAGEIKYIIN